MHHHVIPSMENGITPSLLLGSAHESDYLISLQSLNTNPPTRSPPSAHRSGALVRFGRFITIPDIEAQLAVNNYMYTRSMIYSLDNYSTTGNSGIAGADQELDIPGGSYARHGGDALALERANRQSLPKSPVSQQHNAERSRCDTERHNRRALDQRFRQ
jgi:hypothetical protein